MDTQLATQARVIETKTTGSPANSAQANADTIAKVLPQGKSVSAKVIQVTPDQAQSNSTRVKLEINNSILQISAKFTGPAPTPGSNISIQRSSSGQIQLQVSPQNTESAAKATPTQNTTSNSTQSATLQQSNVNNIINNSKSTAASNTTANTANTLLNPATNTLKAPVTINASGNLLSVIEKALPQGTTVQARVISQQQPTIQNNITNTILAKSTGLSITNSVTSATIANSPNITQPLVPGANNQLASNSVTTPTQAVGLTNPASTSPLATAQTTPNQAVNTQNQVATTLPTNTSALSPSPTANTLQTAAPNATTPQTNIAQPSTTSSNIQPPVNSTNPNTTTTTSATVTTTNTSSLVTATQVGTNSQQTSNTQPAPSITGTSQQASTHSSSPSTTSPISNQANTAINTPGAIPTTPTAATTAISTTLTAASSPALSSSVTNSSVTAIPTTPTNQVPTLSTTLPLPQTTTTPSTAALATTNTATSSTSNATTNVAANISTSSGTTVNAQGADLNSANQSSSSGPTNPSVTLNTRTNTALNNLASTAQTNTTPAPTSVHSATQNTTVVKNAQLNALPTNTATIKVAVAGQIVSLQAPANLPTLQQVQITRVQGAQANLQWQQPAQPSLPLTNNFSLNPKQSQLVEQQLRLVMPVQIPMAEGINQLLAQSAQLGQANSANNVNAQIDKVALSIMQMFGVKPGNRNSSDTIKRNVQQGGLFTENKLAHQSSPQQGDMKNFLAKLSKLADQLPAEQRDMLQSTTDRMLARVTSNQLTHVQQQHVKTDINNERTFQIDIPVLHNEKLKNVEMEIKQRKHLNDEGDYISIWSVKLHFDLQERGEVDAEVALNPVDNSISTTFLCTNINTVREIEQRMQSFRKQLHTQGFEIQTIHCTQGSQAANKQNPINKRIIDIRT
jgi:hypothetical protein